MPKPVWFKVKEVDEERAGRTVKATFAGFGPNRPGPSGLGLADACFVGPLAQNSAMDFTSFAQTGSPDIKQIESI